MVFDKTGTLTTGRFVVTDAVATNAVGPDDLIREVARLEGSSEHPLARAIVAEAGARKLGATAPANIQREPGLGVVEQGVDAAWSVGNVGLMTKLGVEVPSNVAAQVQAASRAGGTSVYVAQGDELRGFVTLADELRPDAAGVMGALAADGLSAPVVLTGDSSAVASQVARRLEIAPERVRAELLPEDKVRYIQEQERAGIRVCYVGDGTNDGPALAAASVGVSLGSRSDTVALETAHAVLMRDSLEGLPLLLRLGRATARTINQNLIFFGLIFNASMIAASAAGWLTPILGALGHNLGSVAVVLNSARLLRFKG